jgi:hypothetical protein
MGSGVLWGGSTMSVDTTLWTGGVRVGAGNVSKATSNRWFYLFVDPFSMTDSTESMLAYGEIGQVSGLRVGPPNSWYCPHF